MSEGHCEVELCSECDEPFSDVRTAHPKARGIGMHCCECGGAIVAGEEYERTAGLVSGRWDIYRTCGPCSEVAQEFFGDGRVYGGMLWEGFEAEWEEGANVQGCMNRLSTARAKAHMNRQWMKWKGLQS